MQISLLRPVNFTATHYTSQEFGEHPEWYVRWRLAGHNGIDYPVPIGTPVIATHAGKTKTGNDPNGYGNFVRVYGAQCETIYGHLSKIIVANDEDVSTGQQIGLSGNTGNSTGPHLHWGLRIKKMCNPAYGDYVDPTPFRDI